MDRPVQAAQAAVSHVEYSRLIRLCTWLIGDAIAAEDLAQDTLIVAWCHADRLRDPTRQRQWLAGIARKPAQVHANGVTVT
jgi:DNA-directed RNA polymerase specialized sigma24 family protein